jgi:hypothetical protein
MRRSSGVTGAAPIWNDVVESVVGSDERMAMIRDARESMGLPLERNFQRPNDVVERSVCAVRSLNVLGPECKEYRTELVRRSQAGDPPPAGTGEAGGSGPPGGGTDVWTVVPAVAVSAPPPPPPAEGEEAPAWPPVTLCLPGGPGGGQDRTYAVAVLPLPQDERERQDVQEWAARSGWVALEPSTYCSPEMLAGAMDLGSGVWTVDGEGRPKNRVEYRLGIAPGTVLTRTVMLTGTVQFDPNLVEYFKVELGRGETPTEWLTVGDTHQEFVINGPLEVIDPAGLAPGPYVVRLVLVGKDGNFIQPPHAVPILVSR